MRENKRITHFHLKSRICRVAALELFFLLSPKETGACKKKTLKLPGKVFLQVLFLHIIFLTLFKRKLHSRNENLKELKATWVTYLLVHTAREKLLTFLSTLLTFLSTLLTFLVRGCLPPLSGL
jgi:hypothetical protein